MSSASYVRVAIAATLVMSACGGTVKGPRRARMSTKEIVSKFKPGIVRVESPKGVGTGFFLAKDGRIATNLHVIEGATELRVVLSDKRTLKVERVLAVDKAHDLAIISVGKDAAGSQQTLSLGDSDGVAAGDRVIAIGNPLGVLDYTVSDGLISAVRQLEGATVLQISAPISVGSSGGPLFNGFGEVIGVTTSFAAKGQNLNFGMPANYLKPMLAETTGVTVAEFGATKPLLAERLARVQVERPPQVAPPAQPIQHPRVNRRVPDHPVSILDGCNDDILIGLFQAVQQAIAFGAPLYNRGDYEACAVIYRRVVAGYEADARVCKGVREALGQGLLRVGSVEATAHVERAWALRDTFDGVLRAIYKKAQAELKAQQESAAGQSGASPRNPGRR